MIDSLYKLIEATMGYSGIMNFGLIFANQNISRMPKPYIVMNVMNIDIPDHLIYLNEIDSFDCRVMAGWRKATVELQIYNGIKSLDTASRLAMYLQSEQSLEEQQRLNVAIGARLFFAYMPEIINTSQFEGRAIYHFEFFYTEQAPDYVGAIETVIVDGDYIGSLTVPHCHEVIVSPPRPMPVGESENG